MKNLKIACLGEAMIEIIADPHSNNATLGVAGDSMNTAIYLARNIGEQHKVAFVSMVGLDPFSDRIVNFIANEGVSTDLVKRHRAKLPGIYSISTNDDGERSFSYWREASAARELFSSNDGPEMTALNSFDVIFMSAISLAILPKSVRDRLFLWIESFRAGGGLFVFDSNYRPALWASTEEARFEVTRAWTHCDIALPSMDDEMALFDDSGITDILQRLRGCGVKTGVVKRGELGPISIEEPDRVVADIAKAPNVVDTTAAGDSFNGGFLANYLTTGDLFAAMRAGHDLAVVVVGHRGAIIPRGEWRSW